MQPDNPKLRKVLRLDIKDGKLQQRSLVKGWLLTQLKLEEERNQDLMLLS